MTRIRRASLLIVLAQPDDEIFHGAVLAHLSERGVRVTLVCATDGEAGKPHPSVGHLLGDVRGPVPRWPLQGFFDGLETAELH